MTENSLRIFLVSMVVSLTPLSAQSPEWKLYPAIRTALEEIRIGEITSARGTDLIVGSLDEQSRNDYLKAMKANDKEGIDELISAGKLVRLPANSKLRILERDETSLGKLMENAHQLLDIDIQSYRNCLDRNLRRTRAGLRLETCSFDFDSAYAARTSQCLKGDTPENYVDAHVLVLVRVLDGAESGKKLWILFGDLSTPSHSPPATPK